ncbi:phage/plasmid primase, P4 family [Pseudooceanicola sp. C21-150M6]|uniref:phage/plasmid primase, P4 family n=1 Tax=Pseudooceanicola sp. C21-150M6 TaxID=3434355 RepID=UPI003D7F7875
MPEYHNTSKDRPGQDRPFAFTIFADEFAYRKIERSASLIEIEAMIRAKTADEKGFLPWIKLATFGPNRTAKRCLRHDANVESVTGVEGDHDAGTMTPEEAANRLRNADILALIYTTASHMKAGKGPRWRVLCPFSSPLKSEERAKHMARLNGVLGGALAAESFTLSQAYYFGTEEGSPPVETIVVDGRYLNTASELDAVAKGKPGRIAKANGKDGRLDEAAALKAIRTSTDYHMSAIRLAGHWAALGEPLLRVGEKLLAAFNEVPEEARDTRWHDRVRSIPELLAQVYGREAAKIATRPREEWEEDFDWCWRHQHPGGEEPQTEDPFEDFALDHDGAIKAFAATYAGEMLFDNDAGRWFRFDGNIWRREKTKLALHYSRAVAVEMAARDPRARALKSVPAWEAIERGARAAREFSFTATSWDAAPMLLGTPGGVVDLTTGQLRHGRPEDYISKSTAVPPIPLDDFDPKRDCPQWLAFLDQALGGDTDAVSFFQRWAGYNLTGATREQVLLFIFGPGGSGKTTAIMVLAEVMGEYSIGVATSTLTAKKHEAHPEELARLHGPRMAYASETERGSRWAENRIKSLTGGDTITARFMRQDSFDFRPAFKLTIVGNNAPALENVDSAIKRRFLILPFDHPPATRDEHLTDKLKQEWPGILSWAISGALDWQRDGLGRPGVVERATQQYFEEQDPFTRWLREECVLGSDCEESTSDLFKSWDRFAAAAGVYAGDPKGDFAERLSGNGFKSKGRVRTNRQRGFVGLRLKSDDEEIASLV